MQKCIPAAQWIPRSTVSIRIVWKRPGSWKRRSSASHFAENSVTWGPRDKSRLIQGAGKGPKLSLKLVSASVLLHDAAEKEIHWKRRFTEPGQGAQKAKIPTHPYSWQKGEGHRTPLTFSCCVFLSGCRALGGMLCEPVPTPQPQGSRGLRMERDPVLVLLRQPLAPLQHSCLDFT